MKTNNLDHKPRLQVWRFIQEVDRRRKAQGMSLNEIADLLDVTKVFYWRLVNGYFKDMRLSYNTVINAEDFFDIDAKEYMK